MLQRNKMGSCCRLKICVLPKFLCWNLMPYLKVLGGGVFKRCFGQKGGGLMGSCPYKMGHRECPLLVPCSSSRKEGLTRPRICRCLHFSLPATRTMGNEFLLFIHHPVYGIFIYQPGQLRPSLVLKEFTLWRNSMSFLWLHMCSTSYWCSSEAGTTQGSQTTWCCQDQIKHTFNHTKKSTSLSSLPHIHYTHTCTLH